MSLRRGWNILRKCMPFIGVAVLVVIEAVLTYYFGWKVIPLTLVAIGIVGLIAVFILFAIKEYAPAISASAYSSLNYEASN